MLHFVYNLGWFVRHVIEVIRIEDGVASFVDTFMLMCRVLAAWVDFLWGMLGYDFFDSKTFICMFEKIPHSFYRTLFFAAFGFIAVAAFLVVFVAEVKQHSIESAKYELLYPKKTTPAQNK